MVRHQHEAAVDGPPGNRLVKGIRAAKGDGHGGGLAVDGGDGTNLLEHHRRVIHLERDVDKAVVALAAPAEGDVGRRHNVLQVRRVGLRVRHRAEDRVGLMFALVADCCRVVRRGRDVRNGLRPDGCRAGLGVNHPDYGPEGHEAREQHYGPRSQRMSDLGFFRPPELIDTSLLSELEGQRLIQSGASSTLSRTEKLARLPIEASLDNSGPPVRRVAPDGDVKHQMILNPQSLITTAVGPHQEIAKILMRAG